MPDRSPKHIAVLVLRLLLGVIFIYLGILKFPSGERRVWPRIFAMIGFGQWFRYVTGAIEGIGGALLILPRTTVVAAVVLICTMIGAIVVHIFVIGLGPQTIVASILIVALSIIALEHRRQDRQG